MYRFCKFGGAAFQLKETNMRRSIYNLQCRPFYSNISAGKGFTFTRMKGSMAAASIILFNCET